MSNTRVRIDLSQGVVEAEGSEDFVRSIYDDFKDRIQSGKNSAFRKKAPSDQSPIPPADTKKKARKPKTGRAGPSIVKDLDLSPKGDTESLRDFYAHYLPKTNFEKNLIFVYWLQQIAGMSGITEDHVFTCYRSIPGIKAPVALYQSLIDTSNRRGWLNTTSTDDIKVTVPGMNYLEHDLPRADS